MQHPMSRLRVTWCLAVVFGVLFAATCAHGKPVTSFADYLASKRAPSTTTKVQSGYDYVEVDHACLKEVSNKNCRSIGDTIGTYYESGVTCCDGRGNSGNSLGSSALDVGSCKFTETYFSDSIIEAPGVEKLGEFIVQCYLNSAAEACGHPFCEQMVLSAAGGIYYATDIVLASRPITPIIDDSCSSRRKSVQSSRSQAKGKKLSKITVRTADVGRSYEEPSPTLYTGNAYIYFGPMLVNSRVHDVKYTDGWFEYVFDYEEGDPITEGDAEGKHVVDPYAYALKFYKPHSSHY